MFRCRCLICVMASSIDQAMSICTCTRCMCPYLLRLELRACPIFAVRWSVASTMPRSASNREPPPPPAQPPQQSDPASDSDSYSYSDEESAVADNVQTASAVVDDAEALRQQCKVKDQEAERLRTENAALKRRLELSEKEGHKSASSAKLEAATHTKKRKDREEAERRGAEKQKTKEKERERNEPRTREKKVEAAKTKIKKEQREAPAADAATRDASTMANARTADNRDAKPPGAEPKRKPSKRVATQTPKQSIKKKGSIQMQPPVVSNSAVAEDRPRNRDQDTRGSGSGQRQTVRANDQASEELPDFGGPEDSENDDKDKASSDSSSYGSSGDESAVKDERKHVDWSPAKNAPPHMEPPPYPPDGPRGSGSRPRGRAAEPRTDAVEPREPIEPMMPPGGVRGGGIVCVYIRVEADNTHMINRPNVTGEHLADVATDLRKHGPTIILASCGHPEVTARLTELLTRPPCVGSSDGDRGGGERPELEYLCSRWGSLLIAGRKGIVKNVAPGNGEEVGTYDCFSSHVSFNVPFHGMLAISVAVAACRPALLRGRNAQIYCPMKAVEAIRLRELLLETNVRVLGANLHGPLQPFLDHMREHIPIQVGAWHPWTIASAERNGTYTNYCRPAYIFVQGPVAGVKPRREFDDMEVVGGPLPDNFVDFMFPNEVSWQTSCDGVLSNEGCRGDGDQTIDWPPLPDIHQKKPQCILNGTTKLSVFSKSTTSRRSEAATEKRRLASKEAQQRSRANKKEWDEWSQWPEGTGKRKRKRNTNEKWETW